MTGVVLETRWFFTGLSLSVDEIEFLWYFELFQVFPFDLNLELMVIKILQAVQNLKKKLIFKSHGFPSPYCTVKYANYCNLNVEEILLFLSFFNNP